MARIRTIKPEFFRHEGLQDLAAEHGAHVMLVFAGLWGHCDRFGRFECKPRHLKLDILPFLEFDMAETIRILEVAGFVQTYEVGSKRYGFIPSFAEHQRFGGKEASEPARYPEPPVKQRGRNGEETKNNEMAEMCGENQGSNGEATVKQSPPLEREGNGIREGEGKGEDTRAQTSPFVHQSSLRKPWPPDAVVPEAWLKVAAEQRRLAGLPPIDLAVSARMFANFYGADDRNPRTLAEFQAKFNNWILKEKANGAAKRNTTSDTIRELARMAADAENGLDGEVLRQ